ncbi:MAG TPA: ATP-binding protein [Opitutaceae bacterium]|nr:ATP-binding protein [Opitutaceae bacterium]
MKHWWQRRTLRFRLAIWYATGGAVLLACFSFTLYTYVAGTMARPLDYQLRRDLAEVERRLAIDPAGQVAWDGKALPGDGRWNPEDPWFELWDERGRLVARCWPFVDGDAERLPLAPPQGRETLSVFSIARDLRLRVLSVPYRPGGGGAWMLRVLSVHQPTADALGALRWIIFIALPVVVTLLVLGGYAITRRWLKPLDLIVSGAESIRADDLSRRLAIPQAHDELGRLATAFNLTLERLEASFKALDRFVADASHELRTPLTTLRSVGEVGLRRERTPAEYREIIGSMLEEAQRLHLLVERLLELARTEGGAPPVMTRVRLDEYVSACVAEIGILAEYRDQRFELDAGECAALTDPVIFRQALQNLLDNAIKYSPAGSVISVGVRGTGTNCEVTVSDRGPGIPAERRSRLAERFYRPESSNGRPGRGFGLGLSLTKAYVHLLGGTLEYLPREGGGSTFRLVIPRA